ncbi:MAG: hypothetical protein K2Y37_13940 [Pirellulales bacterium]|nr:hypothetical protein [Pirellulales bacterium]
MTDLEWKKLEETLAHMTPEDKVRLLALVNSSLSRQATAAKDPLLGLMADEPELIDQVVEAAYAARERHPLRLPSDG